MPLRCLPQAALAKTILTTAAGMSAPQGLLAGGVVAGYISWSYSSAAKLNDAMETQVYVSFPRTPPAARNTPHSTDTYKRENDSTWAHRAVS